MGGDQPPTALRHKRSKLLQRIYQTKAEHGPAHAATVRKSDRNGQ
jgi:hypothetical protein